MPDRIVYVYFMEDKPEEIRQHVAAHVAYWKNAQLPNYQGGPFNDRSGGLIVFDAPDLESAAKIVADDPFQQHQLLHCHRLKVWLPE